MGRIADEVTHRAEVAVGKMEEASTTIEQARIVADLGVECSMMAALLCDDLSDRVLQLEVEVGALMTGTKTHTRKSKEKGAKKGKETDKMKSKRKGKKKGG